MCTACTTWQLSVHYWEKLCEVTNNSSNFQSHVTHRQQTARAVFIGHAALFGTVELLR